MLFIILSYIEWERFFLKKRANIDPWLRTSKDEVWAVSLKPTTYQSHCLIKTFYLILSRLPITYMKSRRQEQEICVLLVPCVFAKMSSSFLLWKETPSPQILALLDFIAFKWAQVFIALTWQMFSSLQVHRKSTFTGAQQSSSCLSTEMWALQQNINSHILKHIGDVTKENNNRSSWRLEGTLKWWK